MKYNQTLPNFRKVLRNNWSLLNINIRLKHIFKEHSIIAYRRNKNLRYMIGDTNIENNKVVRKQKPILKSGQCHFKNLSDNSLTKLQEQLNHILIRMFKMSNTACWEIRNRIQYKT